MIMGIINKNIPKKMGFLCVDSPEIVWWFPSKTWTVGKFISKLGV
jgi:hypothetical protein